VIFLANTTAEGKIVHAVIRVKQGASRETQPKQDEKLVCG